MTRSNNFDALRLIGALLVVVGHAYHLLGRPADIPFVFGYPVQTLGVVVFFSISGYLISASWTRGRDPRAYFAARCLRIFPGLVVVVAFWALVAGPVLTVASRSDYLSDSATWTYLRNIVLFPVYNLPGVFTDQPYPNAVNGSLWTLPAEFFCYLVVPIVCVRAAAARVPITFGLLFVALALAQVPALESPVIYGTRISDAAGMWVFFAAGSLLHAGSQRWQGFFRADVAALAVLGQLAVVAVLPEHTGRLTWIFLPYVILTAGLASTPYVRRAARFGDLSYGLYLWAFPVQQVVVDLLGVHRMSVNLVLVTVPCLVLAWCSWHVIEAPSMRLKERIGGRRPAPRPQTVA